MSKCAEQINEYLHVNGVDTSSVVAGTEYDLVLAGDSDWELTGESWSEPVEEEVDAESPVEPGSPEETETPESSTPEETGESGDPEEAQETEEDAERAANVEGLLTKTRDELNQLAAEKGIEDPASYSSKAEVAEAIVDAESPVEPGDA